MLSQILSGVRGVLVTLSSVLKGSTLWTVLFSLIVLAIVAVVVLSYRNPYPGVPLAGHHVPVLGHLLALNPRKFHLQMQQWGKELGGADIFQLQLLTKRVLIINGKKYARDIAVNRPGRYESLPELAGQFISAGFDGVLVAEGARWSKQRRFVAPAFNSARARPMLETVATSYDAVVKDWPQRCAKGEYVDVAQYFHRLTCHIILRVAFAFDPEEHETEADELAHSVRRCFDIWGERMFFPIPIWKIYTREVDAELTRHINRLHALSTETIEKRLAEYASNTRVDRPKDLLDRLLEAHSAGEKLTTEEVVGNLLTFFIAGQDTTANSLTFTMQLLVENPHVLAKLRQEVDDCVAEHGWESAQEKFEALPYLNAVFKESMRVKTVAPMGPFTPSHELKIGEEIPAKKGDYLVLMMHGCHYDKDAFHEPDAFTPERWLPGYPHAHDEEMYLPFGAGPRICPGRALSKIEFTYSIASIVYHYNFALKPNHPPISERLNLSNGVDVPVEMKITPRH